MSVLTELLVPADEFVLSDTVQSVPDMRIEIERVVANSEYVTPYFWTSGESFDAFERALRNDEGVRTVRTLDSTDTPDNHDEDRFYQVHWNIDEPNLITAITNVDGTILEAVNTDSGQWMIKTLFPDDQSLATFHENCDEMECHYELLRVYRPDNPQKRAEYGLTAKQQEALEAAYDAGYYDIPRSVTLETLADRIGISRNALSARLRRGQRNLIMNTLIHEE